MGIINDQDDIYRRYEREGEHWELHLSNTRQFITECLEISGANYVAILGSGWLLDIPVDFLSKHFERVDFYDLRHPKQVLKKYTSRSNFCFIPADLTGGLIKKAYQLCSGWREPDKNMVMNELQLPDFKLPRPVDYIVSVNLLYQLDILLIDYVCRFCKLHDKETKHLRKQIQEVHLKLLKPGASCLITNYEEVHLDKDNTIIGKLPLVHCTLPAGKYRKTWTWNFDTQKTYSPDHYTAMNVVAIKF